MSYKNTKISCVIAAWNEGPRVAKVLKEVLSVDILDEVVIVNDGSTDNTLEEIEKFKQNKKLKVFSYAENKGKGNALAIGIENASNDLLVLVDADMSGFIAEHFSRLADEILDDGNDIVLASPYVGAKDLRSFLQNSLLPLSFSLMGIRAFKRKEVLDILERMKESKYGVESLVANHFLRRNKKIKNIRLFGIHAPFKSEKKSLESKSRMKAWIDGLYHDVKMYAEITKTNLEYSPIPTRKQLAAIISEILTSDTTDDEVFDFLELEKQRQRTGLELIPSENYVSSNVLTALGSVLTNKYSEGFPRKRYYEGNKYVDEVEIIAQQRALKLFDLDDEKWGVCVQPYSGSPANHAVYFALLNPGDTVMGLALPSGGHLTHGWNVNFSAKYYKSVQYHVKEDGEIDYDELEKLVKEHKPKLVWAGATAYTKNYDYERLAKIIKPSGAYFAVDIAHVAGLIVGDVHNSPFEFADVVTTTTHKTLRGPRGGMVYAKSDLIGKINSAIFPGLQGGPHNHQTAAIAVALGEALRPEFKEYAQQIVKNAKALADALQARGIKLAAGGTENHLMLMDFSEFGGGRQVECALEIAGITTNKNTIPGDNNPPYYPSGVRIGTPALTSRGMKEEEMKAVAGFIARVVDIAKGYKLPVDKDKRSEFVKNMKIELTNNQELRDIRNEVRDFAKQFPVPGIEE